MLTLTVTFNGMDKIKNYIKKIFQQIARHEPTNCNKYCVSGIPLYPKLMGLNGSSDPKFPKDEKL